MKINFKEKTVIFVDQMDNKSMVMPLGIYWISVWMMTCTDFGLMISVFQVSKGAHTGPDSTLSGVFCKYFSQSVAYFMFS